MTQFATANDARIVKLSLGMPLYGLWVADVELELPGDLTGVVSLVVGTLSLVGSVYRQGSFGGMQRARIVGGYGGWRRDVLAASYSNPAGVRMSTVLFDLAAACGEQIAPPSPDTMIGRFFVRESGRPGEPAPASRILRQLIGPKWYVDAAGVTQVGERPSTSIATAFTIDDYDAGAGAALIATEDLAAWLPGVSFAGPTASGVVGFSRLDSGNDGVLRLHVLVSP